MNGETKLEQNSSHIHAITHFVFNFHFMDVYVPTTLFVEFTKVANARSGGQFNSVNGIQPPEYVLDNPRIDDDVMTWNCCKHHWSSVMGIRRWRVYSPLITLMWCHCNYLSTWPEIFVAIEGNFSKAGCTRFFTNAWNKKKKDTHFIWNVQRCCLPYDVYRNHNLQMSWSFFNWSTAKDYITTQTLPDESQ